MSTNIIKREPVASAFTAFVTATIALMAAFGVDFTAEQIGAIIGWIAATSVIVAKVRSYVWTPKSVEERVQKAVKKENDKLVSVHDMARHLDGKVHEMHQRLLISENAVDSLLRRLDAERKRYEELRDER